MFGGLRHSGERGVLRRRGVGVGVGMMSIWGMHIWVVGRVDGWMDGVAVSGVEVEGREWTGAV